LPLLVFLSLLVFRRHPEPTAKDPRISATTNAGIRAIHAYSMPEVTPALFSPCHFDNRTINAVNEERSTDSQSIAEFFNIDGYPAGKGYLAQIHTISLTPP
jgi:hypothetical protein